MIKKAKEKKKVLIINMNYNMSYRKHFQLIEVKSSNLIPKLWYFSEINVFIQFPTLPN